MVSGFAPEVEGSTAEADAEANEFRGRFDVKVEKMLVKEEKINRVLHKQVGGKSVPSIFNEGIQESASTS